MSNITKVKFKAANRSAPIKALKENPVDIFQFNVYGLNRLVGIGLNASFKIRASADFAVAKEIHASAKFAVIGSANIVPFEKYEAKFAFAADLRVLAGKNIKGESRMAILSSASILSRKYLSANVEFYMPATLSLAAVYLKEFAGEAKFAISASAEFEAKRTIAAEAKFAIAASLDFYDVKYVSAMAQFQVLAEYRIGAYKDFAGSAEFKIETSPLRLALVQQLRVSDHVDETLATLSAKTLEQMVIRIVD